MKKDWNYFFKINKNINYRFSDDNRNCYNCRYGSFYQMEPAGGINDCINPKIKKECPAHFMAVCNLYEKEKE